MMLVFADRVNELVVNCMWKVVVVLRPAIYLTTPSKNVRAPFSTDPCKPSFLDKISVHFP